MEGQQTLQQPEVDYSFIEKLEGNKLFGYVPGEADGKSGVTIASGFDLGQRNITDLQKLGPQQELIDRFEPYLGLRGTDAINANPRQLRVTPEEARAVNIFMHKATENQLVAKKQPISNNLLTPPSGG